MILADENIPSDLIAALRGRNITVLSIFETNRGITDEAIIEMSKHPPRIILTEDKDFGEWVFAHGIKTISVIFLRYSHSEQEAIQHALMSLIEKKGKGLFGMFITVTTKKIRYRTI